MAHGIEVRGKPLQLDFSRYEQIERDGRLICVVARDDDGVPHGYSWHYWYKSLHFSERVGHDDLWYVTPEHRNKGVGMELRRKGLDWLKRAGAVETSDMIREHGVWPGTMTALGYERRGNWWIHKL
jgi:GNAT superfamily N-acetyltransferase